MATDRSTNAPTRSPGACPRPPIARQRHQSTNASEAMFIASIGAFGPSAAANGEQPPNLTVYFMRDAIAPIFQQPFLDSRPLLHDGSVTLNRCSPSRDSNVDGSSDCGRRLHHYEVPPIKLNRLSSCMRARRFADVGGFNPSFHLMHKGHDLLDVNHVRMRVIVSTTPG